MASPLVSRKVALKNRTHHQFIPGIGYLAHDGPPELPAEMSGGKNCEPPSGSKDGSAHMIRPPNGAAPMAFLWAAGEKAWASPRPEAGNRLAWAPTHLSRAGWEYGGPAKD